MRRFGEIELKVYLSRSNKYYPEFCTIYCDKHGCKHKHKLEKYHYLLRVIDIKKANFEQYKDETIILYFILIPFFIFSSYYNYLKK